MANRTDVDAATIHGTNPQNLVEKIIRSKIYESIFWKEHCFALNAETIVDRTMELKAVGGAFQGHQPSSSESSVTHFTHSNVPPYRYHMIAFSRCRKQSWWLSSCCAVSVLECLHVISRWGGENRISEIFCLTIWLQLSSMYVLLIVLDD